ncbi:MAG: NAD(P)/FAD-dependent oxidoreductase [Thermoplasmata archaeon]
MILMNKKIVIIGAGSTGSSIAYNLSKNNFDVIVIDRDGIAEGNTGKSSALIRTHYSVEMVAKMAIYSYDIISNFDDIGYSGFTKTGMIFPFDRKYKDVAEENVAMLRTLGAVEEEMDSDNIKNFYPDANLEGLEYIVYEPNSGYADPVAVTNSYINKVRELGGEILIHKIVKRVDSKNNGVKIYLNDGKIIEADMVVLATNVWTNELLLSSGISKSNILPIIASLHSIIYIRRPLIYKGLKPTLWDPPNLAYYKMEGETLTALGSLDPEIDKIGIDLDKNIPQVPEQEYVEDYIGRLIERLPSMKDAGLVNTYTGLYDMTPDGQLIMDSLEKIGLENVYVVAGLSGHGFKLCPAIGKMFTEMIMNNDPKQSLFDWTIFSLDRFKNGKLITSKYTKIGTIY